MTGEDYYGGHVSALDLSIDVLRQMEDHVVMDLPQYEHLLPKLPSGKGYDDLPRERRVEIENVISERFGSKDETDWDDEHFFERILQPVFSLILREGFSLIEGKETGPEGNRNHVPSAWVETTDQASLHVWPLVRFLIQARKARKDGDPLTSKAINLFRYMKHLFGWVPFMPSIYGLILNGQCIHVAYTDHGIGYISRAIHCKRGYEVEFVAKYLFHVMESLQHFVSFEGQEGGQTYRLEQLPGCGSFWKLALGDEIHYTPDVTLPEMRLYDKNTVECPLYSETGTISYHLKFTWSTFVPLNVQSRLGTRTINSQGSFLQLQDDLGHYGERLVHFFAPLGRTLHFRLTGGKLWQARKPRKKYMRDFFSGDEDEDENDGFKVRRCELIVTKFRMTCDMTYGLSGKTEVHVVQWIRSALCYSVYEYATMGTVHGDFSRSNLVLDKKDNVLCTRLIDPACVTTPTSPEIRPWLSSTDRYLPLAFYHIDPKKIKRDLFHELESCWWNVCQEVSALWGFKKKSSDTRRGDRDHWSTLARSDATHDELGWAKFWIVQYRLNLPDGLPECYDSFLKLLKDMHAILFHDLNQAQFQGTAQFGEISRAMQARQLESAINLLACMDGYLAECKVSQPFASVEALQRMLLSDEALREKDKVKVQPSETTTKLLKNISKQLKRSGADQDGAGESLGTEEVAAQAATSVLSTKDVQNETNDELRKDHDRFRVRDHRS